MTAPPLTEAAWQQRVVDYAQHAGWRVAHFQPAQVRGRWMTAMVGHAGFPDLVLARAGRVLFAELKTQAGRVRPSQRLWLAALGDLAVVWRPTDWPDVVEALR